MYTLDGAAGRLGNFEDDVARFHTATGQLENFSLHAFVNAADDASTAARAIQEAEVSTGPDADDFSRTVAQQIIAILDEQDDRQQDFDPAPEEPQFDRKHALLAGFGLGVVLSALILWAVVWLTQGASG
jgi:hypothetical protein